MKKQSFCKKAVLFGLAGILLTGNTIPAFAGQWITDERGRRWQRDDGTYPVGTWETIDDNNDGWAEYYCFDKDGYLLVDTVTPTGSMVNADGAFVQDGVVQAKKVKNPNAVSNEPNEVGWYHDGIGWKYRLFNGAEYYNASGKWVWSDPNNDGTAELYWFQDTSEGKQQEYLLTNDVIGGIQVNENGARLENGVVLTQPAVPADTSENTYNAQGISNIALEMLDNTREENAKFGEVWIHGEWSGAMLIQYANGFQVCYPRGAAVWKEVMTSYNDGKRLFQYYDGSKGGIELDNRHQAYWESSGGYAGIYCFVQGRH